jgi:excinuclease UvrABC nuclease subunit
MRLLVREAETLEVRIQPSEQEALAVENELIRTLDPPYNVEGKYSFLYPAIGVARADRHTLFCFTTNTDAWSEYAFRWFGTFRSRVRAKEAFDALVDLVALLGHLERTSALGSIPNAKGSRLAGVRQLSAELVEAIEDLLSGASRDGLIRLTTALLEKPRARREAADVQQRIDVLDEFYRSDLQKLNAALRRSGRRGNFVSQDERDTLFIRARE